MAKMFSVASWNDEHFKSDPARANKGIGSLNKQNPHVMGMYEAEGTAVFAEVTDQSPACTFQIAYISMM